MAKDYLTQFLPDLKELKKTMQFHNEEIHIGQRPSCISRRTWKNDNC